MHTRSVLLHTLLIAALLAMALPWVAQPALAAPQGAALAYTARMSATRSGDTKVIVNSSGFPGGRELLFSARAPRGVNVSLGTRFADKNGVVKTTLRLPAKISDRKNLTICAKDRKNGTLTCVRLR